MDTVCFVCWQGESWSYLSFYVCDLFRCAQERGGTWEVCRPALGRRLPTEAVVRVQFFLYVVNFITADARGQVEILVNTRTVETEMCWKGLWCGNCRVGEDKGRS